MKNLILGKISGKELADWFGITPATYKNRRKVYLEKLKSFCAFEEVRGGVVVTEVYIDVYIKNMGNDDKIFIEELTESNEFLSTISGMVRKLQLSNSEYSNLSLSTARKRLSKAGERLFGKINKEDLKGVGICGTRQYVWAVKVDDYNNYRFKTEEEEAIYQEILQKYATSKDAGKELEFRELLRISVEKNELTAEEALVLQKERDNFFNQVIIPFKEATGCLLVRVTKYEVVESELKRILES